MNVFITRQIPDAGLSRIREEVDQVDVFPGDTPIERSALEAGIQDAHGLLCLLTEQIDQSLIQKASNLKVISNYAVGYDNIDVDVATEQGILVTNTPGVLTRSTAELTWALLLSTVRRVVEADSFVREGQFTGWSPTLFRGLELGEKTLGILGAGRIGRAVGRIGRGFDMSIIYHSRSQKPEFEQETGARSVSLEDLLAKSDVLSLHCPSTPETRGLLDESVLRNMKKGAYLINTARGDVIDEAALVKLLQEDHLAGAGLDVFEQEPEIHPGLIELDNVVLLPHIGSATHETRDQMAQMAAENVLAGLQDKTPPNLVNGDVLD